MDTKSIANELLRISKELVSILTGVVIRTADLGEYSGYLKWEIRPKSGDDESNFHFIGDIAWKELKKLENKDLVDFYQNDFHVYILGKDTFGAEVEFHQYDVDRLPRELKRMGFKIYNR